MSTANHHPVRPIARRLATLGAGSAVLCAWLLAGCTTLPDGQSQLLGQRFHRASINTYPLSVVKVDGESTSLYQPIVRVDPGLRRVTVESRAAGGLGPALQQDLPLQVAPCTRYYLVAERTAPFLDRFTPRVDHQEPVPGCRTPAG